MNWLTELLEDDYYGLWEVLWRFNQVRPQEAEDRNLLEAKRIVANALRDGAVCLYDKQQDFMPVLTDDALRYIEDLDAWNPDGETRWWLGLVRSSV